MFLTHFSHARAAAPEGNCYGDDGDDDDDGDDAFFQRSLAQTITSRAGLHLLRQVLQVSLQEQNLPEIASQRVASQSHFQRALFALQA